MSTVGDGAYWFTAIDVSEVLEVPVKQVYELLEHDELRGHRVGRTVLIPRPEVERFRLRVADGRPTTTT